MEQCKNFLVINIIQVLRTLQITLARVIREHIIRQYEIFIYTCLIPQGSWNVQLSQANGEGVLFRASLPTIVGTLSLTYYAYLA
jgi:hypothetical protein